MLSYKRYQNTSQVSLFIIVFMSLVFTLLAINNYKMIFIAFVPLFFIIFYYSKFIGILILIIFNESIFYLTNSVNYNPIILGLLIITILIAIHKSLIQKNNYSFLFKNNIYMIIGLIFFEVLIAFLYTGQDIMLGLDASQRYFRYLFYFYLNIKMNDEKIADKVVDMMILIASILAILYIIQARIYPNVKVFNMSYMIRDGNVRFYTGINLITFSAFLALEKYFSSKDKKYIIATIILISEIYIVGQTRSITIPLIMILFYKMFISKKISSKQIIKNFIIIVTIVVFILIKPQFIENTFISVYNEISNNTGTSGFRIREISFYMNQFMQSPIWGIGIYSDSTQVGYEILGRHLEYYQNDIGVIGFIATFGIFGMAIFATIIYKAVKVLKKCNNKYGELMILFIIFSLFFNFYLENNVSILYILITLCYLESKYINNKANE